MKEALDLYDITPALPERDSSSGCALLWQAVLMDCFACRFDTSRAGRKQAQRDRAWVVAPSQEPYSFAWLCQQLGVEPQATREAYFNGDPFTLGSLFMKKPSIRRRQVWRAWVRESTHPKR